MPPPLPTCHRRANVTPTVPKTQLFPSTTRHLRQPVFDTFSHQTTSRHPLFIRCPALLRSQDQGEKMPSSLPVDNLRPSFRLFAFFFPLLHLLSVTACAPTNSSAVISDVVSRSFTSSSNASVMHQSCGLPADKCSFVDQFKFINWKRWKKPHGYTNGPPFNSWWSRNNVRLRRRAPRGLVLSVSGVQNGGTPYASGQLQSKEWYGYGCYEVRMKPVLQPG